MASMTTRAAVLHKAGQDWEITELDLDEPKDYEVLINYRAAGLVTPTSTSAPRAAATSACRWSAVTRARASSRRSGRASPARSPATTSSLVHPGLRELPVLLDRPPEPVRPRRCRAASAACSDEHLPLPPQRRGLRRLCALGTFSDHTVVSEYSSSRSTTTSRSRSPALVGCGVTTGWGSAVRRGRVARRATPSSCRLRRHRHQRRPGRPLRRRQGRDRDRPRPVQARGRPSTWARP